MSDGQEHVRQKVGGARMVDESCLEEQNKRMDRYYRGIYPTQPGKSSRGPRHTREAENCGCSLPEAACPSSPNLVLKTWGIPAEPMGFNPLWEAKEAGC